ncbi:MAG: 50S ribosomal protein L2 [Planctomycetota bacterium]
MGIRKYNPTTPGRRQGSVLDWSELTDRGRIKPAKSLLEPLKSHGGRNNLGRTTSRFRGGGAKRMYRKVDFRRNRHDDKPGNVLSIEYDPNRSANIARVQYPDGSLQYILAPVGMKQGDTVLAGLKVEPRPGNCMPIKNIPQGLDIHNIELNPGQGGKLVRSAGTVAVLSAKEGKYATVVMPSGEMRKILLECRATIGRVGNLDHQNVVIGKAGRKRWMGRRPHNRGSAMNPVAHPMGGGEGRRGGGRHPCSKTGLLAKGGKTRQKKKWSNNLIIRGRKFGKHVAGTRKK